ncbi:MAG TPA: Tad domain-containing protein [Bryobacterales bacterium]|nr:Tad domain-containing protein [Bryobacterales bacterium]
MTNLKDQRSGQLMIVGALLIVTLLSFLGLAVDGGTLLLRKRHMQTAADGGALYGIQEVRRGRFDQVETTARLGAQTNGFQHGVDGATVTVNRPPLTGDYTSGADAVEVIVCQPQRTYFLSVLNIWDAGVCARGVAAMVAGGACVISLNPTEEKALYVHSGALLDADCGVQANSNNPGALDVSSGSCLRAEYAGVTGGTEEDICLLPGYGTEAIDPAAVTGVPPLVDPLLTLPPPPMDASCPSSHTKLEVTSDMTINPGTYCEGIKVGNGNTLTLNPGIYVVRGDLFDIAGTGSRVYGRNVMIYLTDLPGMEGKGLKVGSAGELDITAPSGGVYNGIAIYVDRTLPYHKADVSFESASTISISGVIYAPNQIVRVHSNSQAGLTAGGGLAIVGDFVEVTSSGSGLRVSDDFSSYADGSPLKVPVLVE